MPDVVMPRLSDTMTEGVLSRWLKQEGDTVRKGDVLAEIETDKATMDLEAFESGVLERLLVPEGASVPIGQPIAVISAPGSAGAGPASGASGQTTATSSSEEGGIKRQELNPTPADSNQPAESATVMPPRPGPSALILMSPLARRIAHKHNVELSNLTGTGPGGRIVRADVEAAVTAQDVAVRRGGSLVPSGDTPVTGVETTADSEEIPLSTMRRVTARRLTESAAAPHFFLTNVVDVDRLLAFRTEVNERFAEISTRVSVTDLLVRASAVTLRAHPHVNSSWGQDKIIRHHRINIGVAVAVEDGLMVPVVTDADKKGLDETAAQTRALAERARAGRLTPDEFSGGTFTISNLGMYGVDNFTAVINPPEAAILAVGAATDEPFVRDGQLLTRRVMKITLTADHRVLDGATAAAFLQDLKRALEEPLRMIL
ncbi:dihydrolipoamide acetyltransferase family protein [Arthrobacter sp. H5]|uniref:dihydrolipoamide acetyltransferase family protein n=1 Tax=Arthrobacter sp. H5 TaxID=1267973 RepID=UPI0004825697|nr:dihydrolipoamide acetyltransferase family protein [Arthrobacter sp. H5]